MIGALLVIYVRLLDTYGTGLFRTNADPILASWGLTLSGYALVLIATLRSRFGIMATNLDRAAILMGVVLVCYDIIKSCGF